MFPFILSLSVAYSTQVPVSGRGHASNPVWSNTGTKLAYEVNDYAGKIDLYTIDVADSNPQGSPVLVKLNVTTSSFSGTSGIVVGDPIWHEQRDGMLFFEASYTGVARRIYMTHRNSPPREMIRDSDVGGDLAWSSLTPDGNSLLFTSDATGSGDIYKYEIPTQKISQLTATDNAEMSPRLHANGSMVYTFKNAGGEDLFLMENGKLRVLDKAERD
jgi:Tol biopolymer transport system component